MPGEVYVTQVTMAAVSIGQLPFPRLNISCSYEECNRLINLFSYKSLPTTLYVLVCFLFFYFKKKFFFVKNVKDYCLSFILF